MWVGVDELGSLDCHKYTIDTMYAEAEVEWFYEDLQDLLELTNTPKRCPFHYRGLEYKSRKSRNT